MRLLCRFGIHCFHRVDAMTFVKYGTWKECCWCSETEPRKQPVPGNMGHGPKVQVTHRRYGKRINHHE